MPGEKVKKLRVLYILDCFPVHSQTFILNELLAVKEKGVDVIIVALSRGEWAEIHPSARALESEVSYIDDISDLEKITAASSFLLRNRRLIKDVWNRIYADKQWKRGSLECLIDCCYLVAVYKGRVDHVHAHFAKSATDYAYYLHLLSGIPYTFTSHGYDIFRDPPGNMAEKTEAAYAHITISDFNRNHLLKHFGLPADKVKTCCLGVDLKKFFYQPETQEDNIILSVGRLEPIKGHVHLIKACRKLRDEGVDFQCRIVGDGQEKENLLKLISEYNLDRHVQILGGRTNDEVADLYKEAKVFVLPSLQEGLPVVLMEALACGVPAVASNITGVPEIIQHEQSGLLSEPGAVGNLTENLKRLLADSDLRQSCSKGGRAVVEERFNLDVAAENLIKVWKECLQVIEQEKNNYESVRN